jgi:micrococcal nuclease
MSWRGHLLFLVVGALLLGPSIVSPTADHQTPSEAVVQDTESPSIIGEQLAEAVPTFDEATDTPPAWPSERAVEDSQAPLQQAEVVEVIDGDTVKVRLGGQIVVVRLVGIDATELNKRECFSLEARDWLMQLILGQTVELEADPSQDDRDRFGRLLRYLWLGEDNVNWQLLAEGMVREYTFIRPYRYRAEFLSAESSARALQRGFWSASTCGGTP